jgi:hypothetical protein
MEPGDLVLATREGLCWSNVVPAKNQNDKVILGAPFLTRVIALFDVGKKQMRFAQSQRAR